MSQQVRYDLLVAELQLQNVDARLVYLAIQYHLGRPGSELDQNTGRPAEDGLRGIADALEPQLQQAIASIELSGDQRRRLDAAISGAINELKAGPLLREGGGSTVPGFVDALHKLFPDVAADPDEALPLAGHMLQLRRKLEVDAASRPVEPERGGAGPWWRFWRRS